MIKLTKINSSAIVVNAELIEYLEASPDTIITLTTGQKILVKDSVEDVIKKVIEYKNKIHSASIIKDNEMDL